MRPMRGIHAALCLLILSGAALALSGGCLYIPYNDRTRTGGITDEHISSLVPAVTSRTEVLLSIGPPSVRHDDDRLFVYKWLGVQGSIVGLVGSGINPLYTREVLCIFFDEDRRFKRAIRFSELMILWDDDAPVCRMVACNHGWRARLAESCVHRERGTVDGER